ncbi:MAG: OFA family MFS transporter [Oscillospiraceae bacterium]|nr:OFA family MFS transporter [Oscillospiraceae bacterium]
MSDLNKKRWLILAACCLVNLCLGSIYAWSVFALPMAKHLSIVTGKTLTSGDLAIVYTIANAVGPITMISGGWFNDKFGPGKVILIGGILFAGGMILSGFATSLPFLIFTYGIIGGLGLGMAYGCTISSCVKFFPDKRGLIGGITTAVYGFSSVLIPPVVTLIVSAFDIKTAFCGIGAVFLVVICFCSFLVTKCPDNYIPAGWTPPLFKSDSKHNSEKDWKGMLATPIFYVMIVLLTCGAFCGMMIISQASAVAQNMVGMTAMAASTAVSVLAACNAFGRILAGSLSDKIGRINTLMASCIISVVGLMLLYITKVGGYLTFYIGISLAGLCFGAFMGVFPGFTADQFGVKNNSVNYGIMFIGFAAAGFFGPTIMRTVYARSRVYQPAFLIACGLNIAGIVLTVVYRFMNGKNTVASE